MLKNTKTAEKTSGLLGKFFVWVPLEPTAITISSVFLALFGFLAYDGAAEGRVMSLFLFLLAFCFDVIDGAVARAKNKVTKNGAFIDGVSDRIVEFLLLLTMLHIFASNTFMQSIILSILFFGTCMTAFVKAYSEHQGLLSHEKAAKLPGLLERAERSILLMLGFAFIVFGFWQYGVYVFYLVAALSFITFAQRVYLVLYQK